MIRPALDWFERRTGALSATRSALTERIPGGASWRYVFGSGVAFAFAVQVLTGVALAFNYSPSATTAWPSVWYIEHQLTLGWLARGLHHFGASAMVVLVVLHLVQVFVAGAYKAPREVNWITGVMLLGLVLAFSLTGYLLPWDQKGYWATRVATNIAGGLPVVGETLQSIAQGGSDYGNFTLTRFYSLHMLLLPALLVGLIVVHVVLFRRHGVTPPASQSPESLARNAGWFWPSQLALDLTFCALIFAVLVTLAAALGAPLEAPADPSSDYDARPEWYFLALFQLLKYFEGPFVLVGTVVIPGLASAFLLLLPFFDRSPDRRLRARKLVGVAFFGGLAGVATLTVLALRGDAADPGFQAQAAAAAKDAEQAASDAADPEWGIDESGHVVLFEGRKVFRRERCGECHAAGGERPEREDLQGPELDGLHSRAWICGFLENPSHPRYFGRSRLRHDEDAQTGMPAFKSLGDPALGDLTEFLAGLSGEPLDPPLDLARSDAGKRQFADGPCAACHTLDGTAAVGPTLAGYGGRAWLERVLAAPSSDTCFGELGQGMPSFEHLGSRDRDALVSLLLSFRRR